MQNLNKFNGALVDTTKSRLSHDELYILKFLYERPGLGFSVETMKNNIHWNDRKVASMCSILVGMDLIKSSEYKRTLTDDEEKTFSVDSTPVYFIPNTFENVYKRRAANVINTGGLVHNLEYIQEKGLMNLWPLRDFQKKSFEGELIGWCTNNTKDGIHITFDTPDDVSILREFVTKKFKVTVEII